MLEGEGNLTGIVYRRW